MDEIKEIEPIDRDALVVMLDEKIEEIFSRNDDAYGDGPEAKRLNTHIELLVRLKRALNC